MKNVIQQWIADAEAFEFSTQYAVEDNERYTFIERQGDFYITLINNLYCLLENVHNGEYNKFGTELSLIAKGLLVYSEKSSQCHFRDVDKNSNQLCVAAIYYLIGYETIATFLLKEYNICNFSTDSAKLVFYIISGMRANPENFENQTYKILANKIVSFFNNEADLIDVVREIEAKFETFKFISLDDFFDTFILKHVCLKLANNNIRQTLYKYDDTTDWNRYISFSVSRHILSFLPSQLDAISKGLLSFEKAFSLKMPTSGGKSFITELLIYQELQRNPKAKILYLAPLRSLSRELKANFNEVAKKLKFKTRAIYGGSISTIEQDEILKINLLISTPEAFLNMEDSMEELMEQLTLVICDEGQLLDSLQRGINYELLLTRLKRLNNIRFLFLSAIIPNIGEVNNWLGGNENEVGDSSYRPCPIKLAVLKHQRDGGISLSVKNESFRSEKFKVKNFSNAEEVSSLKLASKKSVAAMIAIKSLEAGQTLIFTSNKKGKTGCEAICTEIKRITTIGGLRKPLEWSTSQETLSLISEYIEYQLGKDYPLAQFINYGFGYHHGSLPQHLRELIENAYVENVLPLLVCTSTLAEGVNLPVHTIVPYCISRYNHYTDKMVCLTITELKNILGRVGRAGKQQFGVVIVPDENEQNMQYKNIVNALSGENQKKINGTLYEIAHLLNEYPDTISDSDLNKALQSAGFSDPIDMMLVKSSETENFDAVNVDNTVSDSLAYHLGDDNTRKNLKRVFRIRKNAIIEGIQPNDYDLYKKSGLSITDFPELERIVNPNIHNEYKPDSPSSIEWIMKIVSIIASLSSWGYPNIQTVKDEKSRKVSSEELSAIISAWISGKEYWEIANCLKCHVDDILDIVDNLQTQFYGIVKSVFIYLQEKHRVNVEELFRWSDMLRFGVDSESKLMLIRSGMTDRSLINVFPNVTSEFYLDYSEPFRLKSDIYSFKTDICEAIKSSCIPQLSKQYFDKY